MESATISAWHNAALAMGLPWKGELEVFVCQLSLSSLELQPDHDNDSGVMI